ncbi:hypothetical protein BKA70DRAFT_1292792 [Coprinopsis sp. MPI-PUGE-AT-0042]|nr:hypothetical protein BKA70DRAFT_1292792 [Coprinopsis sp. MPI-PUGE-AT-0042]
MAYSPPIRRLSTASNSNRQQEELINAYEAEEERIINLLSRKLEQLRQEKIGLENALEAESESHVNRLSRELTALRLAQHQLQQQQQPASQRGWFLVNHPLRCPTQILPASLQKLGSASKTFMKGCNPADPSVDVMLETLRRENEQLRNKLVDTERDFVRISRLNDIYREELIEHRRRLGISTDNLDWCLSRCSFPTDSSSVGRHLLPSTTSFPAPARPSHSPGISVATTGVSVVSANTNVTSPPSSASLHNLQPLSLTLGRGLSYIPSHTTTIPLFILRRRNSNARRGSVSRGGGGGSTLGESTSEHGVWSEVAETGTLVPRRTRKPEQGRQSLDQQLLQANGGRWGLFDKFDTDS